MTIRKCHYIKTDGRRCGSPALRGQRFCYFHYEVNRPTVNLDIPPLEDGNAVQVVLTDLARAVADGRIDTSKATVLGYILQTAAFNLKRVQFGAHRNEMVRELPEQDPFTRGVSTGQPRAATAPGASARGGSSTTGVPNKRAASVPAIPGYIDPRAAREQAVEMIRQAAPGILASLAELDKRRAP